ncbi:MAG: FAD-dependent oxidoreductase [Labrys sp. (in: a-proteobacteria)]
MTSPDIIVIGTGMGGATLTHALADSGARILVLDKGAQLPDRPENRDTRAIFQRGFFRPNETWYDHQGAPFNPGNYYVHGGNSKFYGGVLIRYRERDFEDLEHADGLSPAWPIRYGDLAPYYDRAEALYQVRGALGEDPTEPPHGGPYPFSPVPDEPPIAATRARLKKQGLHPFSLPLGVDITRWLAHGKTPWDAYPDARTGKMDAETCALLPALKHENVTLVSNAEVERLILSPDRRRIEAVEYVEGGERKRVSARLVVLAAGAVRSAVILLASDAANRSDMVGRHFMNHNASAMLAVDPFLKNDSVYQKTFGLNDFYFSDGRGGPPLGNVQLLGKVSAPILKANAPAVPEFVHGLIARHAVDFYLMSEDLPDPRSRVMLDGRRIVLAWQRSNMTAHEGLVKRMRAVLRAAGFPIVLSRLFDRRTPSHQCGTVRMGNDPATSVVDPFGRSHDHANLFVVDAGTLVTSAAVNPSLTVAAIALRAADHIKRTELAA